MEIYNGFPLFSKISEELKNQIKIFYVFDDKIGINVLFITSEDQVFSFGSNAFGCCGFGHNSAVNEPQVIPELGNKNILQFANGADFVVALNYTGEIFVWGRNHLGQFGNGIINDTSEFHKPSLMRHLDKAVKITCGLLHTLVQTSDGKIYGWGDNKYGQVGCGKESGNQILSPTQLDTLNNIDIKEIKCSLHRSFALTQDSLVYSWGRNFYWDLGHEFNQDKCITKPTKINISNIASVGTASNTTYFLSNKGYIYFCGKYLNEANEVKCQKSIKILTDKIKFRSLHCIPNYKNTKSLASAASLDSIYYLYWDKFVKADYDNIYNYYSRTFSMTYETIDVKHIEKILSERIIYRSTQPNEDEFKIIKKLGQGGFGKVYEVENQTDKSRFAIKQVNSENANESDKEVMRREVDTLSKCSDEYVVKYFDSWNINDSFYIQMELCSQNLRDVILQKSKCFGRESPKKDAMNIIEYFISCELFKELLECVEYLHESNPQIIHRDLKPENILIIHKPYKGRFLKICDFGLAKFSTLSTKSHTPNLGTPNYMAPELFAKNRYNFKVDIFSIGKIAQELFDFDINDSEHLIKNAHLDDKGKYLEENISKMIKHKYKKRPTCTDLLKQTNCWAIRPNESKRFKLDFPEITDNNYNFFKNYFKLKVSVYSKEDKLQIDTI